ncbi:hypothetical protein GCM10008956_29740 [Deinococcus arenae]|uniref:Uncharacterized protein n=1 Tax=Deinococcus arenae TaxID=1452751 RepID=A0A8H9GRF1_9DEIO|nr:hypothetical protein GCM10008956_29740 [Deinococcus arenae]
MKPCPSPYRGVRLRHASPVDPTRQGRSLNWCEHATVTPPEQCGGLTVPECHLARLDLACHTGVWE